MIRFWLLIVVLLCAPSSSVHAANDAAAQAQLRARIGALARSIESEQAKQDGLSRELQTIEQKMADARAKSVELDQAIAAQREQIHQSEKDILDARQRLDHHTRNLRQQIRAAYAMGRQSHTQLLLSQDDIAQVGRVLVYYDYLQRAQVSAINGIRSRVAELEALNERLQSEIARLSEFKAQQLALVAQLRDSRTERGRVLDKLRTRISGDRRELARLQADEQSLNRLVQGVQKAIAEAPPLRAPVAPRSPPQSSGSKSTFSNQPFTQLRGKLPWPVSGRLLAAFGDGKAGGKLHWRGHWIAAAEGTPIRAVAQGRVVHVGWLHRYGLIVLIEHDHGYFSLYGHTQSVGVRIGEPIGGGQVIASAGSSGGHDRSGVYFELRKGAQAINPRTWLAR